MSRRSLCHLDVHPAFELASLNTPGAFSSSIGKAVSHQRRRSSASSQNAPAGLYVHTASTAPCLETIPATPNVPNVPMSLSRSPSPRPGGGWASPGLTSQYANLSGRSSPAVKSPLGPASAAANPVTWESAKAKTEGVNGYPSFSTQHNGFFQRHMRTISNSLPIFTVGAGKSYAEKEKLGRGRWMPRDGSRLGKIRNAVAKSSRKTRLRVLLVLGLMLAYILFYSTCKLRRARSQHPDPSTDGHATAAVYYWRRAKIAGGGKKHVIILAANQGGGVMEWKGPREWAIERDSVRNKKKYAAKWGYDLEIVDMSTKKRYAHEWRESWEKVDTIRNCLKKYPDAEW